MTKLNDDTSLNLKENLTKDLASLLHEEWRDTRKTPEGTYQPRFKTTQDAVWKAISGTDQVDIANTTYQSLPEDWKGENKVSAEVAVQLLIEAIQQKKQLDKDFIEYASDIIHIEWLKRNGSWASEEQKLPYSQLPEEEKEKDRAIIKKAIRLLDSSNA